MEREAAPRSETLEFWEILREERLRREEIRKQASSSKNPPHIDKEERDSRWAM